MKQLVALTILATVLSCNSGDKKVTEKKDKYEQTKETLEETEKKNPTRFLSASINKERKNLIGEKEEFFGGTPEAKADRDLKVKAKLYIAPRDEKIPSKRGEIYKNIALIYVESGKVDEAITEFGTIIDDKVEGYSALARLSQASLQVSKNDLDGAIANYKALAADKKADQVFRDVAVVLQVLHSLDREDPKTLEAVLTPLTNPSNAFNMSALELSALLAAKQGDTARAAKMLTEITADIAVPPSMRERAEDLAKLYQSGITPPPPSPASLAPVAPAPVPSAAAHAPAVAPAAKP
jgi:hypothetical protein